MSTMYRFSCGCSWPVVGPAPREGALPLMDVDDDNLPFCPLTWDLLGRGDTKGVFQLESNLGRQWTKKLKPESGEHMGALGALLRPGCLRAVDDEGVSMTQHFCRRKNNEEEVKPYHEVLDMVLSPTFGCLVYQEQAMLLAQNLAAFNLQEADQLRKAIGKKLPEEMAKCKKLFTEGAKKAGLLTEAQAEEVFGWIEQSQRYSFNKSHAVSYGLTGYDTAYIKAHFPVAFYCSWLRFAREKQDPMQEVTCKR
jgi:DNA polymerase-3 subunit alpha